MAFIDDKKSVMKEVQQIKRLFLEASKRSHRLSVEFLWEEEESPMWNKTVDGEAVSLFLDQLHETSFANAESLENLNALISNGRASRGGDARS